MNPGLSTAELSVARHKPPSTALAEFADVRSFDSKQLIERSDNEPLPDNGLLPGGSGFEVASRTESRVLAGERRESCQVLYFARLLGILRLQDGWTAAMGQLVMELGSLYCNVRMWNEKMVVELDCSHSELGRVEWQRRSAQDTLGLDTPTDTNMW